MLGRYADTGMNFVEGAPLNERNRVEVLIDDQGLYREVQVQHRHTPAIYYCTWSSHLVLSNFGRSTYKNTSLLVHVFDLTQTRLRP